MQALIFIGLLILGVITYYVFSSIKYIVSGHFMFKKWYDENFAYYIWGVAVCIILGVVYAVSPDSVNGILVYFAINPETATSPVMVGLLIAGATKRLTKTMAVIETAPAPTPPTDAPINPN